MRKIPINIRKQIDQSPFYHRCVLCGKTREQEKIEVHHNLIYAGRQVNDLWTLLPLCKTHHDDIVHCKERCNWVMCNRASISELIKYGKVVDYVRMKKILNEKFGGTWSYQGHILL